MAWFDDPDNPGSGWCCQKGQAPTPIDTPYALPGDFLWASNWVGEPGNNSLPPYVCDEYFLGVPLPELAGQWGLLDPPVEPAARVAILAELAWRLVTLINRHYRGRLGAGGMFAFVRDAIETAGPPPRLPDPPLDTAFAQAYMLEHVREIDPNYATVPVEFQFQPARYAQVLLGMPGPDPQARFTRYTGLIERGYDKEPGPHGRVYRFLCGLSARHPILVELDWSCDSPVLTPLMGAYSRRHVRRWFPGEEAAQLAAYGKVAIRNIYNASVYQRLGAGHYALPREGEVAESLPSYGVLAQIHCRALASASAGGDSPLSPVPSAHAIWVGAWGRLLCLQAALAFEEAGLRVTRYGLGRVTVQVPKDRPQASAGVAARFHLEQVAR